MSCWSAGATVCHNVWYAGRSWGDMSNLNICRPYSCDSTHLGA